MPARVNACFKPRAPFDYEFATYRLFLWNSLDLTLSLEAIMDQYKEFASTARFTEPRQRGALASPHLCRSQPAPGMALVWRQHCHRLIPGPMAA